MKKYNKPTIEIEEIQISPLLVEGSNIPVGGEADHMDAKQTSVLWEDAE